MKTLLIVDAQPSFAGEQIAKKITEYVNTHKEEYNEIYSTVFQNKEDSMFVKLLDWKGCMDEEYPFVKGDIMLSKSTYGLSAKQIETLKATNSTIDVIGGDLDACVLAIAFQLFDNEIDFRILTEYCFSSAGEPYFCAAERIMKHCFGSAAVPRDLVPSEKEMKSEKKKKSMKIIRHRTLQLSSEKKDDEI
jgi:nicotinamidase-related amidase